MGSSPVAIFEDPTPRTPSCGSLDTTNVLCVPGARGPPAHNVPQDLAARLPLPTEELSLLN